MAEQKEESDCDADNFEEPISLEYMMDNYIGIEEVRSDMQNLQESIDKRFDEFEEKMEKKLEVLENKILTKCQDQCDERLRSIRDSLRETVNHERNAFKEDIQNELERGVYIFKRIDGGHAVPIDTGNSGLMDPMEDSFVNTNVLVPKQSTPKVTKVNWKDFPMQEDFIRRQHEGFGWKKNTTVKKTIFTEGCKRKLWNDEEVWRKRVCYRIDAQYKANIYKKREMIEKNQRVLAQFMYETTL